MVRLERCGMLHMDELRKNNINKTTASVDPHQSATMKIIL